MSAGTFQQVVVDFVDQRLPKLAHPRQRCRRNAGRASGTTRRRRRARPARRVARNWSVRSRVDPPGTMQPQQRLGDADDGRRKKSRQDRQHAWTRVSSSTAPLHGVPDVRQPRATMAATPHGAPRTGTTAASHVRDSGRPNRRGSAPPPRLRADGGGAPPAPACSRARATSRGAERIDRHQPRHDRGVMRG